MLEAQALDESASDRPEAPISAVQIIGTSVLTSEASARERIVEARRLVQCASRLLGTDSNDEPFGMRLVRALVLNLLDELSVLDRRWGR